MRVLVHLKNENDKNAKAYEKTKILKSRMNQNQCRSSKIVKRLLQNLFQYFFKLKNAHLLRSFLNLEHRVSVGGNEQNQPAAIRNVCDEIQGSTNWIPSVINKIKRNTFAGRL